MGRKIGIWILGARGSIATSVIFGVAALKKRTIRPTGMVTARDFFLPLGLAEVEDFVFGGHEVRAGSLKDSGLKQVQSHILSHEIWEAGSDFAEETESEIRPGILGPEEKDDEKKHPAELVDEIRGHLHDFRSQHSLQEVIVVNLTSTEAYRELPPAWNSMPEFLDDLKRGSSFPASVLYAFAAFQEGCPYINFTPSWGNSVPALIELAEQKKLPHCGKDGKTGETLIKTALAPMFFARNLQVMSWEGYNMLGNGDGKTLADPDRCKSKVRSKDEALKKILRDDSLHTKVSIDYVPSLGDWKTAWDFVHFRGFLDTAMSFQFTWQGSDSALAAPLVLDLIRLTEFAKRKGELGVMKHTAAFFKSPMGIEEHDFFRQMAILEKYVQQHLSASR